MRYRKDGAHGESTMKIACPDVAWTEKTSAMVVGTPMLARLA
jgi:hypothetical protein